MSHRQRDAHRLVAERQVETGGTDDLNQPTEEWVEQLRLDVMAASPAEAGNLGRTAAGEVVDAALTIWSPRDRAGQMEVGDRVRVWPRYRDESAADLYKVVNERHHYARKATPEMYVFDCERYSEAV
ncbi:hypothetical protein SAMN04487947_1224 [Halogeometricum rufum]|uniref:Uncharacterized protein n=1 Tax=Halogeometricum rufum TaxID=553469 RepID=A0A1I6GIU7_9EURY|nr:hypothetical protein [Halogeometricum rufum]SFR42104.1 hypothetical protein SAMN04487947_1224 [Halogeometricum rufum]